jgi:hypothetical protein
MRPGRKPPQRTLLDGTATHTTPGRSLREVSAAVSGLPDVLQVLGCNAMQKGSSVVLDAVWVRKNVFAACLTAIRATLATGFAELTRIPTDGEAACHKSEVEHPISDCLSRPDAAGPATHGS